MLKYGDQQTALYYYFLRILFTVEPNGGVELYFFLQFHDPMPLLDNSNHQDLWINFSYTPPII